jgi:peptidyl-tRNA hydrolase
MEEQEEVSQMVSTAVDAAECWLTQGMLTAMNRYNGSSG